jgi:hypothetical protein
MDPNKYRTHTSDNHNGSMSMMWQNEDDKAFGMLSPLNEGNMFNGHDKFLETPKFERFTPGTWLGRTSECAGSVRVPFSMWCGACA